MKISNSDGVGSQIYYNGALPDVLAFQTALIFLYRASLSGQKSWIDSKQI